MKLYAVSNLPDEHRDSDRVLRFGKAAKSAEAYAKKSEMNEGGQKVADVSQEGIKKEEGTSVEDMSREELLAKADELIAQGERYLNERKSAQGRRKF